MNSFGIEIVVLGCPPDRLSAWLEVVAGPLGALTDAGGAIVYRSRIGSVVVQPEAGWPGAASVWFNSLELPWLSSAACARLAARALGCTVVCDPGADYPDVHPLSPVMLEVSASGERLFVPEA